MREEEKTIDSVEETDACASEETMEDEAMTDDAKADDAKADDATADELTLYKDKLLRLTAEFDNFRKRTAKEKETLFSDGRADAVMAFLPLVDNLQRFSEAVVEEPEDSPMRQGVDKITKQLQDILKGLTVTEIPAVGEKFDPAVHNAVMHIEDETIDDETIVEEFQKGYKFGDKVLRFSMVKVAN